MEHQEKALLDAVHRALGAWERYEEQPPGKDDNRLVLELAGAMAELRKIADEGHRDMHDAEKKESQKEGDRPYKAQSR